VTKAVPRVSHGCMLLLRASSKERGAPMDSPRAKRMLSYPDLKDRKGIAWSRAHVYRQVQAGKFPKPVKLGEGTAAWVEDEIDRWLDQRIAERNGATA
jgi:prophage regulatory protein